MSILRGVAFGIFAGMPEWAQWIGLVFTAVAAIAAVYVVLLMLRWRREDVKRNAMLDELTQRAELATAADRAKTHDREEMREWSNLGNRG